MEDFEYGGFWVRVLAALIDSVLIMVIVLPVLTLIYGQDYWESDAYYFGFWDLVFNYILSAIAVIVFWVYRSATPGKMVLGLKIVDANTGGKVSTGRLIGRYLGYYIASMPFFLGLLWVGWDKRKQGWHDKMAGTLVVRAGKDESSRIHESQS